MNKKELFIAMVEELIEISEADGAVKLNKSVVETFPDAMAYFEAFKASEVKEIKPQFTDSGKLIMTTMQAHHETKANVFKAGDIAELAFISTRSVAGAVRKLITDGYVDKIGENPSIYSLTSLGKEVKVD